MRILIAEDDAGSRKLLQDTLEIWGHEVVATADGAAAWDVLRHDDAPTLAVLDWVMPWMDGVEVCQRVRALDRRPQTYLILLTGRREKEYVVAGLKNGADDYIVKPFDPDELQSRVRAGERIVELQRSLAVRVRELEEALTQVKRLQGLLPICCYCKKIRDDKNYWQQVESYITSHSEARFSHGICPECFDTVVRDELARAGLTPPPG